jgi:hypothetical protein
MSEAWPTREELADYTKAAAIGYATTYRTVAAQVAAREKAAAEKALRDAAAEDDVVAHVARVWLNARADALARADVLAGEGER